MDEMINTLYAGAAVFVWFGVPLLSWWWWQARGKKWFDMKVFNHNASKMIRNYKRGRRSHEKVGR
jgi:hypothetical protein